LISSFSVSDDVEPFHTSGGSPRFPSCLLIVRTYFFGSKAMYLNFCRPIAACLAISLTAAFAGPAAAASKQPIKKLKHDPSVPSIELFEAMEQGVVETTVIAKDSHEANLFVTNKSDSPVSIQFPRAVVATQVLKQLFGQRGGNNGNGQQQGGGGGMGSAQPVGGGMMGGGGGMNQGGGNNGMLNGNGNGNGFANNNGVGNGNGFFSVPPQKTVQVPLKMVCLSHGKPDPRQRMKYQLVKLEDYSSDPVLHETLKLFASGAAETETAQAAVWHLTDKMSWNELKAKQIERIGLDPVPYFNEKHVEAAQKLIDEARELAKDTPRKAETAAR
jgi:hypothetical protein